MNDTIFALSSGSPPAAIAVVRVSGPKAADALGELAGRVPEPRQATLAAINDPGTGERLDRALLLYFPGPGSVTGEDVAELHLHGGRSVVAGVLAALGMVGGLRAALPGEFTRRAFENGVIDLAEAEGLADLLTAETQSQRRAALTLAGGALSRQVAEWQHQILELSASIEARIDFADEEDVDTFYDPEWFSSFEALHRELSDALSMPAQDRLRDGIRVVIAGPPNAGKSTLLNALAGRDAAITSPVAGTTRDLVEAPTAIGGMPFLLVDTAGLRESEETVEVIGIERARASVATADIILWLGDPAEAPCVGRTIQLSAKCDVDRASARRGHKVSALTGEGIAELLDILRERSAKLLSKEGELALNERHRRCIAECVEFLSEVAGQPDELLAAESLRQARAALDRVTGRAGIDEMLDGVFARFCIGK